MVANSLYRQIGDIIVLYALNCPKKSLNIQTGTITTVGRQNSIRGKLRLKKQKYINIVKIEGNLVN